MIANLRELLSALRHRNDSSPGFAAQFAVVCVRARTEISAETLAALQRAAGDYDSDWASYLQPDLFITFFSLGNGGHRADAFASKVSAEFPGLRIGRAAGRATAEFGADGKPIRMPIGGFVNDALRQSSA